MVAKIALSIVLSCAGTPAHIVHLHDNLIASRRTAHFFDERGFAVWRTMKGCEAQATYAGTLHNVWIPVAPLQGDTLLVVHTHPADDGPSDPDIQIATEKHAYGLVLNVARVWVITPKGKVFSVTWDEFRKALDTEPERLSSRGD